MTKLMSVSIGGDAPTRARSDADEDGVAFDLHIVAVDALALVHRVDAGRDVVLPAVPGAGDDHALELALAERAAAMEARVVDRVKGAADVEERDLLAARLDAFSRAGRDVGDRGDLHEVRHAAASGMGLSDGQDASAAAMAGAAARRSSQSPTIGVSSTRRPSAYRCIHVSCANVATSAIVGTRPRR